MNLKNCPFCGTKNSLKEKEKKVKIEYAQEKGVAKIKYYRCSCCGITFDSDFEKENDKNLKNETSIIRQKSVSKALSSLERDFSFVEIERCLKLPPRTLSKWKTGAKKPSAAAAILINLVGVFPWLSYVAASDYDLDASYKIADIAFVKRLEADNKTIFTYSRNNYDFIRFAEKEGHISELNRHILLDMTVNKTDLTQCSYN